MRVSTVLLEYRIYRSLLCDVLVILFVTAIVGQYGPLLLLHLYRLAKA